MLLPLISFDERMKDVDLTFYREKIKFISTSFMLLNSNQEKFKRRGRILKSFLNLVL